MTKLRRIFLVFLFVLFNLFNRIWTQDQRNCKESPLEVNIDQADVIIAGTVRKLERNYSKETYAAYVQIHRVIKGQNLLIDFLNIKLDNNLVDSNANTKLLIKRTNKIVVNGNLVHVKNFGSKIICESNVKPNDVRIFLLEMDSNNRMLYLKSSLIKTTLAKSKSNDLASDPKNTNELCNSFFLNYFYFVSFCSQVFLLEYFAVFRN